MPESSERGALTEAVYYILLCVYAPMHGYKIMQHIQELSGGRVNLGAGTLYGAINAMLAKNWIREIGAESNVRRREYVITDLGKRVIEDELVRLEELLRNGKQIAGGK